MSAQVTRNGETEILTETFTYTAPSGTADSDPIATTLSTLNPLRYRGYVYDQETKLYYLQSRYYNPQWGRFLTIEPNAISGEFDEAAELLGYNLFAYCANNPVMFKDVNGEGITLACVWILKNTSVKSIEWHFYWSSVSNSGGPSGPLLKELARYGIKVIFH